LYLRLDLFITIKRKKRNIYGNATFEETRELQEEGIDVATIPWAPKEDA